MQDASVTPKTANETTRAFREDGAIKTHIGGQALLEGIMMRGKLNWAVAVREPDGNIYLEEHDLTLSKPKYAWLNWPFVRGCRSLVESLALGFKALSISADHAFEPDEDERADHAFEPDEDQQLADANSTSSAAVSITTSSTTSASTSSTSSSGALSSGEMILSMVLGVALALGLFIALPAILTNLIVGEYDSATVLWNIVDGLLRVLIFVAYIWGIGRMSDIKRMFCYHGAEHKTIHCFEHGLPLTPQNARTFPRLHVRCGTAFLIMVMIIAILVYTVVPVNALISLWGVPDGVVKLLLVMAVRILFLPLIAGISYEITVKWAGSHPESLLVRIVLWPGMQMQRLTTHEPDDAMLECAIAAMKLVVAREEAAQAEEAAQTAKTVQEVSTSTNDKQGA